MIRPPEGGVTEAGLWLLGQPTLQKFLDYVEESVVLDEVPRRSDLVEAWRIANDYYGTLESSEGGLADKIDVQECSPSLAGCISRVESDPRFRRAFDTVPTRISMVELDHLVASQSHMNIDHVERLKAQLPRNPTPDELFDFCFPVDRSLAPVNVRKTASKRYLLWSPSSDFRFQEAALMRPDETLLHDAIGHIASVIGISVGFGSNFLSAIQSDNRVLLHNGHHRAYALRDLGHTHAPCIIETVTRQDELNVVASRSITDTPAFYFNSSRPPLLKDFFDPSICQQYRVRKSMHMVEVSFEVRSFEVADFPGEI